MEQTVFQKESVKVYRFCRKIVGVGRWAVHYLCTLFFIYFLPLLRKRFGRPTWRDLWPFYRLYSKISLWGFGAKMEVENHSEDSLEGQFIMVANHRSWLDQVSLLSALPQQPHFFTKESYLNIPILGKSLKNHEAIPVSKKSLLKEEDPIVNKYLESGDSLLLYPEGTRGFGKNLLPFRFGAFKYASDHNIPLLPLYILGTEDILSKRRSLLEINPGRMKIVVGRPFKMSKNNFLEDKEEFEEQYKKEYYSLYDTFFTD